MQAQQRTYTLSEPLLQAVVTALNDMPAGRVRGILNALEAECARQPEPAAAAAPADAAAVQASAPRPAAAAAPRAVSLDEIRAGALG